jgi:hypothetical protein
MSRLPARLFSSGVLSLILAVLSCPSAVSQTPATQGQWQASAEAWQARATGTTDASGQTVVSTYVSSGNQLLVTDEMGRAFFPGAPQASSRDSTGLNTPRSMQAGLSPVTIQVPADQPTIQAAINAANDGDTVLVSDGIYLENINFNGKAITVTSVNGSGVTTIDGGKAATVVLFVSHETAGSVLNGFTITNGFAGFQSPNFGEGGGIAVENSSPTITNNLITNNGACNGAGIGIAFAGPLIQANTISSNFQSGCTGGIGGGGISIRGQSNSTRLIGNVITNNSMTGSGVGGGGIALFAAGAPLIQDNIFTGNNGGIQGGGIAIVNDASPKIVDNLFIHNTASSGGGLWWLIPMSTPGIRLLNNTIADNVAMQGSGIFADGLDSNAVFQNNLITGNSGVIPAFCGNFNNTVPPHFVANDVFDPGAAPYGGICTDQTGNNGNISADPVFVDPSVDDYHLQSTSPAIAAGNINTPIPLPDTDLDGNPRVVNGTVDVGAFEFQGTTTTGSTSPSLSLPLSPPVMGCRKNGSRVVQCRQAAI